MVALTLICLDCCDIAASPKSEASSQALIVTVNRERLKSERDFTRHNLRHVLPGMRLIFCVIET